jgi:hypothetical protein
MALIERARGRGPARGYRRRPRRWGLLLLVVLAGGLAALWYLRAGPFEPPPLPAEEPFAPPAPLGASEPAPAPAAPEAAPAQPLAAPTPAEPLPPLAESDAPAREAASALSSHPLAVAVLRESLVIERFVLAVDNLADGVVPRREFPMLRPPGRFLVLGSEPDLRVDPASYRRYDTLADAIASVDAAAAVAVYRRFAPLCEESYRALGYPEGGFEARLRAALALLASTPRPGAQPALVAQVKRYEFADPSLEGLSDAQKQLLRMGPANLERVVAKLRELEAALGPAR